MKIHVVKGQHFTSLCLGYYPGDSSEMVLQHTGMYKTKKGHFYHYVVLVVKEYNHRLSLLPLGEHLR